MKCNHKAVIVPCVSISIIPLVVVSYAHSQKHLNASLDEYVKSNLSKLFKIETF